jgi:hypothetical protein
VKKILIIGMLCFLLTGCANPKQINETIPADVNTAREVVQVVAPYVQDYWDGEGYHLGSIEMVDQNAEQQGEVRLTYADESDPDAPEVIEVVADTAQHKIVQIQKLGASSKIDPGKIAFDQWKLDSSEALEVAKTAVGYSADFKPNSLSITTINTYDHPEDDIWWIIFQDWKQDLVHDVRINALTGKVTSKETKKLHRGQTDRPLP